MANPKEVYRKRLSGLTKYEYCPYCIMPFLKDGEDYRGAVQPLFYVKTEEFLPATDKHGDKYITDAYWSCSKCRRKITETDFLHVYGMRADGTRYYEDSKPFEQFVVDVDSGQIQGVINVYFTKEGELKRCD